MLRRFVTGVSPIELIDHHKFEKVRIWIWVFAVSLVLNVFFFIFCCLLDFFVVYWIFLLFGVCWLQRDGAVIITHLLGRDLESKGHVQVRSDVAVNTYSLWGLCLGQMAVFADEACCLRLIVI